MKLLKKIGVIAGLAVSLNTLPGCGTPEYMAFDSHYSNPAWAPPYYSGLRYYYLPDIEVYYDLADQEYVYLDNGQWLFSPVLPSIYGSYDLYGGFVIGLDVHVYQPWLHHQYYVSHYPRYYYRNFYRNADLSGLRGFSENNRRPIYWKQGERKRIDDLRKNEAPIRRLDNPRQPQQPNYYGKRIGQPVKVTPQMRENRRGNKKSR